MPSVSDLMRPSLDKVSALPVGGNRVVAGLIASSIDGGKVGGGLKFESHPKEYLKLFAEINAWYAIARRRLAAEAKTGVEFRW